MRNKVKLGFVAAAAMSAALPLLASPAFADYAPSGTDVVGVGSDTVQYAGDFVADGDFLGDPGYNSIGNLNKVINFDATPDAIARLGYGSPGVGTGSCPPGLGSTAGTGNNTTTHADQPCLLNPTVVLRAGLLPTQRINGSGAGGKAGKADTGTPNIINYVRASSAQGATLQGGSPSVQWDSITIGADPLAMLGSSTTNAVPLSSGQLNSIYSCASTARTWNQVGGTSATNIIPIVPQLGSGTRSSFLGAIGNPTLGSCVVTAEENDPFAVANQTSPNDAIEPMSGGRLNLVLGNLGSGASNGLGGYFQDPSCAIGVASTPATNCTTGKTLTASVKYFTTGTPSTGTLFNITRNLYIYFRHSDVATTAPFGTNNPFQPGSTLNFVRTLFYNPCSTGQTGCVTVGTTTYGPGGAPYYATSAGQGLISAAGINPTYVPTLAGP